MERHHILIIRRMNIVKMATLAKSTKDLIQFLPIPLTYFTELE